MLHLMKETLQDPQDLNKYSFGNIFTEGNSSLCPNDTVIAEVYVGFTLIAEKTCLT